MQIANGGDSVYIFTGRGDNVTSNVAFDNGTIRQGTLGQGDVETTILVASTWCSTATGTAGASSGGTGYAVLVSDNGTTGWNVDKIYDNGTGVRMTSGTTGIFPTDVQTATSKCAVTYLNGTFYLAIADDESSGGDNVSLWKTDNLTTAGNTAANHGWTQIGAGLVMTTGTVHSLAIATTGTTASDNGVWIAANDGGNVRLLHAEDLAGGTTYALRSVGLIIAGAGTAGSLAAADGVSIATDGSNNIAVSAVVSGTTKVNTWFNH
jgi:hypothetical protein